MSVVSLTATRAMLDEIHDLHDLLPAYCAGSLTEELRGRVEAALAASPELSAEAAKLRRVNAQLLALRAQIDCESAEALSADPAVN